MAKPSQSAEKPVLLAISHGVYSAIPDKKRAIQNMFCLILVVAIALSMNSNSWYVVSEYEERGEEERSSEIRIGLSEIEQFEYEKEENGIIDIKQSKITISECVDDMDDEGPCSDFEPQGIIMLVILWVSLIAHSCFSYINIFRVKGSGRRILGGADFRLSQMDFQSIIVVAIGRIDYICCNG